MENQSILISIIVETNKVDDSEIDQLNSSFIDAKEKIMDYITGEFTSFGDPITVKDNMDELLENLQRIKVQEDAHYKVI